MLSKEVYPMSKCKATLDPGKVTRITVKKKGEKPAKK
jgi:hypothetical protein